MKHRIIISLTKGADAASVTRALLALGADEVTPMEAMPDVLVAIADDRVADSVVKEANSLAGVRRAEFDQMRFTS